MHNPFEELNNRLERIEFFLASLQSVPSTELPEADLLTVTQAAQLLNLARATVYNLVSRKQIPVFKKGKRLYFSKAALLVWVQSGKKPTLEETAQEVAATLHTIKHKKGAGNAKA
jgi:excisionase family DNA binding protein